jgi:prepilin-type N-terminal cleavage/methylation domain-containing protein
VVSGAFHPVESCATQSRGSGAVALPSALPQPKLVDAMTKTRAFTLIELLVVMVIMATLAGLSLAALNLVKEDSATEKTRLILAAVNNTLSLVKAETGSIPSPVEHPLAGSKAPRRLFVREGGSPVVTSGEALKGITTIDVLASDQNRALLPSDLYADERVPLLFGLSRSEIGILGANLATVTAYRRLPKLSPQYDISPEDGRLDDPYDSSKYPNDAHLVVGTGDETSVKATMDYLFGFGSAWSELTKLGAIFTPPGPPNAVSNRVWVDPAEPVTETWEHGRFNDCGVASRSDGGWVDNWKRYRLPGPAIYDAWGNEILLRVLGNGSVQLASAGPDGAFVWDLGENKVLETMLGASAPEGDDKEGRPDNVVVGVGQ